MAYKENDNTEEQAFRTCPNCYYPLPRFGQFCSHCGQKYTDGKITVGELIRNFLSDTLNLDAKIWRTLVAMLVPGKLTNTFFKGRQQRYIRPVRLFFVFAIIAITAVTFFEAEFAEGAFLDLDNNFNHEVYYSQFLEELDSTALSVKQTLPSSNDHASLDSLTKKMHQDHRDSLEIGVKIDWTGEEDFLSSFSLAKKDIADLSVDSLIQKYELKGFWNQLLLRQNIRLQQQGDGFAPFILNQIVWMMLLIMPILAFYLKVLYVRRKYYYVEHLIFSFHVHAFIFLILTILMLLDNFSAIATQMPTIVGVGFLLIEVYFFVALRKVYQQSRFKTFIKFFIANILYFVTFILAIIFTVLIAVLLY